MKRNLLPFALSLLFLAVGVVTLSDYGINWDGPLHMLRGQAHVDLFLNKNTVFDEPYETYPNIIAPLFTYASRYYFASIETVAFEKASLTARPLPQKEFADRFLRSGKKLSFYQHEAYNGSVFKKSDGFGHLPLVAILSAFSNRLFFGGLGLLGDIESYQIVYVLFSAIGVLVVSIFVKDLTGSNLASLIAGLSLMLYPLFFAEAHFNMKDPIQASFFAGAVWSFWRWVRGDRLGPTSSRLRRVKWFGVFIGFVALALAVKWNIVFLPFILIPWLFLIRKTEEFKAWFKLKRLGVLGLLGGLGIVLMMIGIRPFTWSHPIQGIVATVNYYLEAGIGKVLIQPPGFILPGGFNIYPLLLLLTQTPEIILILGGMGVIWIIRERGAKLKAGYLLLFWLLVPLIRLSLPGARTYGGLRQIMEMIPALAVLSGIGAWYLTRMAKNIIIVITIIIIITVILLLPIVRLHPNQNVYFNSLVGGLIGAKEKNLIDWTLTYGNVYKQGVYWLNKNADKDANLAHLDGSMFAISPLWLRDDISISPDHFSGFEQKGEYIMALYNPLDPPVFAKRYPEKFLKPIHKIELYGMPLLFIYKNEKRFNLLELNKEKELDKITTQKGGDDFGDFWQISLDREYQVSRIWVSGADDNCAKDWNKTDELIFFIPQSQISSPIDYNFAFVSNEKRLLSGKIEYDFPIPKAQIIRIYPQNSRSCFAQGTIGKVFAIE